MRTDLIVVGGGPAGLHVARRVSQAGRSVVLVDERPRIGLRKICTGIIGVEAFSDLDLPTDSVLNEIQNLRFVSPLGTVLEYKHENVLARIVDRASFDADLARRARAAGVGVLSGRRVTKLRHSDSHIQVEIVDSQTGEPAGSLRSPCLVLATGVNSRLNRVAGLGAATEHLNAAQAQIRVQNLDGTICFSGQEVAPGAFAWLVPLQLGWGRIGLMTERPVTPYFKTLLHRVAPFRADDARVEPDLKPIVQRFSGPSFASRVLAVGEAAGQVKTTTGGGIYYGLLGAEIAAEVLLEAFSRGSFKEAQLAPYEQLWKAKLKREIEAGYRYRKLYGGMTDEQIELLFRFARTNGLIPMVRRLATFDWHLKVLKAVSAYGIVPRVLNSLEGSSKLEARNPKPGVRGSKEGTCRGK